MQNIIHVQMQQMTAWLKSAPAFSHPFCTCLPHIQITTQSKLFAPPGSKVRLPAAHMVCNQSPPLGDKPSLMTFREVSVLRLMTVCDVRCCK